MTYSKARGTGQIINDGAPAAVAIKDDGVQVDNRVSSLDFAGAAVQATSDAVGNVTVTVEASGSATADVVDGGNF